MCFEGIEKSETGHFWDLQQTFPQLMQCLHAQSAPEPNSVNH